MQPYQPSEPTWQPPQPDPAGYYPPSSTPSPSPPPPHQAYQPGTYGQQPGYQQPGYQQPEHQQPEHQQPYQQPASGHAAYQQGSYEQSSHGQGPYQQPVTPSYLQTSPEARDALKNKGTRDIVFGVVWLAVGLGITVVTLALMDGAAMIVAWGPALYGIYKIIKGLITVSRNG